MLLAPVHRAPNADGAHVYARAFGFLGMVSCSTEQDAVFPLPIAGSVITEKWAYFCSTHGHNFCQCRCMIWRRRAGASSQAC